MTWMINLMNLIAAIVVVFSLPGSATDSVDSALGMSERVFKAMNQVQELIDANQWTAAPNTVARLRCQ